MSSLKKSVIKKGLAIGGAFLFKQAFEAVVNNNTNKTIPDEPDNTVSNHNWGQAVTYAAFSGAFLGVFKLIVDRVADKKIEE